MLEQPNWDCRKRVREYRRAQSRRLYFISWSWDFQRFHCTILSIIALFSGHYIILQEIRGEWAWTVSKGRRASQKDLSQLPAGILERDW